MHKNLESLPLDLLKHITYDISFYHLVHLCQGNKNLYSRLCQNDDFWYDRGAHLLNISIEEFRNYFTLFGIFTKSIEEFVYRIEIKTSKMIRYMKDQEKKALFEKDYCDF